jgi:aminoglycoside 6'-N-acetyltransferase I
MIREFQPDDLESCARLLPEAYNGEPWKCHWTMETAARYLNEYASNENFVGFVSHDDGALVGAMFAHRKTWWTGDELFVDEMYVTPRLQRQGYGERLLAHAEDYARSKGLAGLTLLTNRHLPARAFYAKHDYQQAEHVIFMFREL